MSEQVEIYASLKAHSQQKRANNRASSANMLKAAGIPHEVKNGGAHIIVTMKNGETVDFWPVTGLWTLRGSKLQRRGVDGLMKFYLNGGGVPHRLKSATKPL